MLQHVIIKTKIAQVFGGKVGRDEYDATYDRHDCGSLSKTINLKTSGTLCSPFTQPIMKMPASIACRQMPIIVKRLFFNT